MKLTMPAKGLERALSVVTRAAAKSNPSNPLLQAVLFEAAEGALRMSATDLELSASLRCAAGVEAGGSLAVGARVLHELVRSLGDGELTLSTGDGGALLAHRYSMRAYAAGDFPKVPDFPREGSFAVPAARFAAQVAKARPEREEALSDEKRTPEGTPQGTPESAEDLFDLMGEEGKKHKKEEEKKPEQNKQAASKKPEPKRYPEGLEVRYSGHRKALPREMTAAEVFEFLEDDFPELSPERAELRHGSSDREAA